MVLGFFLMQLISGFWLSCLILPAHIMPECDYPVPDENGDVENNFLVHQLHTCCNFGTSSRLFSWFSGGINYQVEHHLYPEVSHVHYRNLSVIVEKTTSEFGLPYHSYKSFTSALKGHHQMLKVLGNQDHPF
jgi:linoleoyl-CoA desaturase